MLSSRWVQPESNSPGQQKRLPCGVRETTHEDDFEAAVEKPHAAVKRRFQDPVRGFEDDLAQELGLWRVPGLLLEECRSEVGAIHSFG